MRTSSACRRRTSRGFLNIIDELAGRTRVVAVAGHDIPLAQESLRRLRGLPSRASIKMARNRLRENANPREFLPQAPKSCYATRNSNARQCSAAARCETLIPHVCVWGSGLRHYLDSRRLPGDWAFARRRRGRECSRWYARAFFARIPPESRTHRKSHAGGVRTN